MVFSRTLAFLPEPWNRVERIRQKKTLPLSWEGKKLWIEFKRGEIAKIPEDRKKGTKRGVFEAVNANNTGGIFILYFPPHPVFRYLCYLPSLKLHNFFPSQERGKVFFWRILSTLFQGSGKNARVLLKTIFPPPLIRVDVVCCWC